MNIIAIGNHFLQSHRHVTNDPKSLKKIMMINYLFDDDHYTINRCRSIDNTPADDGYSHVTQLDYPRIYCSSAFNMEYPTSVQLLPEDNHVLSDLRNDYFGVSDHACISDWIIRDNFTVDCLGIVVGRQKQNVQ